jgi:hypothetical protein
MNWTGIAQVLISALASMAGAGPWGVAAMVLGLGAVVGGVAFLIGKWNKKVDAGDLERAGADAGETAVDLKNQADRNREFERQFEEEMLKLGPPEEKEKKGA